jgi:hypothetical protein
MKTYILYLSLILGSSCSQTHTHQKIALVAQLPDFDILSLDSVHFIHTKDLRTGAPILFMYFSPTCDHCQQQTRDLLAHHEALRDTKIYMLTNEPAADARKFYQQFRLDTARNVFVGLDYQYSFYRLFKPSEIPYFAIYDRDKTLKKIYQGQTQITSVLASLKN